MKIMLAESSKNENPASPRSAENRWDNDRFNKLYLSLTIRFQNKRKANTIFKFGFSIMLLRAFCLIHVHIFSLVIKLMLCCSHKFYCIFFKGSAIEQNRSQVKLDLTFKKEKQ